MAVRCVPLGSLRRHWRRWERCVGLMSRLVDSANVDANVFSVVAMGPTWCAEKRRGVCSPTDRNRGSTSLQKLHLSLQGWLAAWGSLSSTTSDSAFLVSSLLHNEDTWISP